MKTTTETKKIDFEFLGQTFVFKTFISEEEIKEVLSYLEKKKREIEHIKRVPSFKLAIWLLLQVAYDYIKLKKEKKELESYLKKQVDKLGEFLKEEKINLGCA